MENQKPEDLHRRYKELVCETGMIRQKDKSINSKNARYIDPKLMIERDELLKELVEEHKNFMKTFPIGEQYEIQKSYKNLSDSEKTS